MARTIKAVKFFNSAFKEFSLYDNVRSIPILFDGMKPSQRKILYGLQQRGENAAEIQVERVASMIASVTDYHHGVGSLASTMIGMALPYAGANNMNLLYPSGQFGSRLTKDPAAARYIFTRFSANFRKIFRKEDDCLLENLISDGEKIEPRFYIPLLPMMLVNGSYGTGTGHASLILNYHPEKVRDACLAVVNGKRLPRDFLVPWFNGFIGKVQRNEDTGQISITGKIEVVNTTTIKITEIPVGVYLDQYKEVLNALEDEGIIKDYQDDSSEDGFDFKIQAPRSTTSLSQEELLKLFKLISRNTENYTVWNTDGVLTRYDTAEDIVVDFVEWRLARYEDRRLKLIDITTNDIAWASMKIRFINFYLNNSDLFRNTGKKELIAVLLENDFPDYDRLLAMQIWSLTRDRIAELEKELDELGKYLKTLESDTAKAMYTRELKEFSYDGKLV